MVLEIMAFVISIPVPFPFPNSISNAEVYKWPVNIAFLKKKIVGQIIDMNIIGVVHKNS